AFFEVMTDTKKVERKVRKYIKVEGFDYFSLLYNWLEELLFIFEAKGLVFSHIEVKEIQKISESKIILEAVAEGENFDPQRHESRTLVKAVTYSLMDISKRDDGTYVVKFVLDI
ncbi:MAG TPA: archease, partial [Thermoprotei archaeon]|nr:archease [Thermoprotei archaeon]